MATEERKIFETSTIDIDMIPPQLHSGGTKSDWGKWRKIIDEAEELEGKKAVVFLHGGGPHSSSYINGRIITTATRMGVKVKVALRGELAFVWVVSKKRR